MPWTWNWPNGARVPKAASDLVGYRPTQSVGSTTAKDPVMEVLDGLKVPQSVRKPEAMSDEAIQAEIERLQAELTARQNRKWRERWEAEAKAGEVVGGRVMDDRGEWAVVRMSFPNGREIPYVHADLVTAYLMGEAAPHADDPHAVKAAWEALWGALKRMDVTSG